jgi:hypothetical protein
MQQTTACDALYIAVTAPGINGDKCATAWKPAVVRELPTFCQFSNCGVNLYLPLLDRIHIPSRNGSDNTD